MLVAASAERISTVGVGRGGSTAENRLIAEWGTVRTVRSMDIDNTRVYNRRAAAVVLDCKESWLRDQVTAGTVPHGRRGKVKGVFFTADDLRAILEARHRPARPHGAAQRMHPDEPVTAAVDVPDRFAGLRSARA